MAAVEVDWRVPIHYNPLNDNLNERQRYAESICCLASLLTAIFGSLTVIFAALVCQHYDKGQVTILVGSGLVALISGCIAYKCHKDARRFRPLLEV
jgi:hypothetical protein